MPPAPKLSPPSSAGPSDNESFHSALLTSSISLLPLPTCSSPEFSESTPQCDARNLFSYDTQKSLCPSPQAPAHTLKKPLWRQSPDFNSKFTSDDRNSRRQRKSVSLPQLCRSGTAPQQSFVKFSETLSLNKSQLHGLRSPHPRFIPRTVGTEALISLAWTGEVSHPTIVSGYAPSRIGATFMWPKVKISDAEIVATSRASRPGLHGGPTNQYAGECNEQIHRNDTSARPSKHRRWTLADAISDREVTNEELVELLEKFRLRFLVCSTKRSFHRFIPDAQTSISPTSTLDNPDSLEANDDLPINAVSNSNSWSSARRICLVCRELILTERNYRLSLEFLAKGESQPAPSSLMLSRLPALIDASGRFINLMERNPSVLGICMAFLDLYKLLEETFMQWCEVVGEFFIADWVKESDPLAKRSNSAPAAFSFSNEVKRSTTLVKRVRSWGKKRHSRSSSIDNTVSMVTGNTKGKARHKTPIKDLAILPTQRITRYVLLFKDFRIHSPISIRPTTERAEEAATILAQKADKAQGHVAFHL